MSSWSEDALTADFLCSFSIGVVLFALLIHQKLYLYVTDIFGFIIGVSAWLTVFGYVPELVTLGFAVSYYLLDIFCVSKFVKISNTEMDVSYPFLLHHFVTLSLIATRPYSPLVLAKPLQSMILTIDIINPILAHWNRDQTSVWRYVFLLVTYGTNRILFMTWMVFQFHGYSPAEEVLQSDQPIDRFIAFGCRFLWCAFVYFYYLLLTKAPLYCQKGVNPKKFKIA